MSTYVYTFGAGQAESPAEMRELPGGQRGYLAELASIGLAPSTALDWLRQANASRESIYLRQRRAMAKPAILAFVSQCL